MIECLRDDAGRITAVCEWLLFNDEGRLDENGKTVFIGELEINPEHRGNGVFKKMLERLSVNNPGATRVFWLREHKYPGRKPKIYDANKFRNMGV